MTIPTGWLIFALRYTRAQRWLGRRVLLLLAIEPCLILGSVLTNGAYGLMWPRIALDQVGQLTVLDLDFGLIFWVNTLYSYALALTGTTLLGARLLRAGHLSSRQGVALALASVAPVIGSTVYSLGWSGRIDLAPFTFTLTGIALFWGFLRYGLLDVVPVARGAVFEALSDGVLVLDGIGRIVDLNRAASRLLGLPAGGGLGHKADTVLPGLRVTGGTHDELSVTQADSIRRLDVQTSAVHQGDGELAGHLVVLRDVSALRLSEERLRAQFHNLPIPTYSWQHVDGGFVLVDYNAAAEAITGGAIAELLGQQAAAVYADRLDIQNDLARCVRERQPFQREMTYQFAASERLLEVTYVFVPPDLITVHTEDITERKCAESLLTRQALHDALTGLPNRHYMNERLHAALASRLLNSIGPALLLLDLDRFKEVNDTLGHQAGDVLLQQIGQRLQEAVRASDLVARLGGDEFAVLLAGTDVGGAVRVAEGIAAALQEPFVLEGQPVDAHASIGIAVAPDHGQDADSLMRCADVAMYRAKRSGTGVAVYCTAEDGLRPDPSISRRAA